MENPLNKFGDQLYVKVTDEPLIVIRQWKHVTLARRPVMGQDGIRYQFGLFFNTELETLSEQTQRTLATIKARNEIAQSEMDVTDGPLALPAGIQYKKMN
jgi:hypothetical protein